MITPSANLFLSLKEALLLVCFKAPSFLLQFGIIAPLPVSRWFAQVRLSEKTTPRILALLLGIICAPFSSTD